MWQHSLLENELNMATVLYEHKRLLLSVDSWKLASTSWSCNYTASVCLTLDQYLFFLIENHFLSPFTLENHGLPKVQGSSAEDA